MITSVVSSEPEAVMGAGTGLSHQNVDHFDRIATMPRTNVRENRHT
jgi:hypothetical protein